LSALNASDRHRFENPPRALLEQAQRELVQARSAWAFTNLQGVLAMNYPGRFMFFGLLVSVSACGDVAQMYPHY
jgi:hypothetical protein